MNLSDNIMGQELVLSFVATDSREYSDDSQRRDPVRRSLVAKRGILVDESWFAWAKEWEDELNEKGYTLEFSTLPREEWRKNRV